MNTSKLLALSLFLLITRASAQVILDNFNGAPGEGAVLGSSSWVGHVTLSGGTLTVRAHDDNGWGIFNISPTLDLHLMTSLTVAASTDSGNATNFLNVYFEDQSGSPQIFTIPTTDFSPVTTYVTIPITWNIDSTQIAAWAIGGGGFTTTGPTFNMTFDQLSVSAIPEPAESAAIAGAGFLVLAVWHRRRTTSPRR